MKIDRIAAAAPAQRLISDNYNDQYKATKRNNVVSGLSKIAQGASNAQRTRNLTSVLKKRKQGMQDMMLDAYNEDLWDMDFSDRMALQGQVEDLDLLIAGINPADPDSFNDAYKSYTDRNTKNLGFINEIKKRKLLDKNNINVQNLRNEGQLAVADRYASRPAKKSAFEQMIEYQQLNQGQESQPGLLGQLGSGIWSGLFGGDGQ